MIGVVLMLAGVAASPIDAIGWIRADRTGVGTGFVIDTQKRLFLTNYHIVGPRTERVEVFFPAYRQQQLITERAYYLEHQQRLAIKGRVLRRDMAHDLVLIELDALPVDVTALSLAEGQIIGEPVTAFGNRHDSPFLWNRVMGVLRQRGTLVDGYPWQGKTLAEGSDILALQLPILEGDSGSPILNERGRVVGMVAAYRTSIDITWAIPASQIATFLAQPAPMKAEALPLVEKLQRLTVWVNPSATQQRAAGFLWNPLEGLVLTTAHAVASREWVQVRLWDADAHQLANSADVVGLTQSGRLLRGYVLASDPVRDVALLQLESPIDTTAFKRSRIRAVSIYYGFTRREVCVSRGGLRLEMTMR